MPIAVYSLILNKLSLRNLILLKKGYKSDVSFKVFLGLAPVETTHNP